MTKTIRIHKNDNVLVAVASIHPGDKEQIEGEEVSFAQQIPIGHKVASRPIHPGDKVVKCGVPIGSATREIARGDHVHLHNVKSDYISTYTLEKGSDYAR